MVVVPNKAANKSIPDQINFQKDYESGNLQRSEGS